MMAAPAASPTAVGTDDTDETFITLQDATFGYDGKAILSNVWLTVGPREVIVVTGHNGSGKTTMTKGILGLSQHLGGSVELFGEPLARFSQHHLIGYVPQRHTVGGPLPATVREVVSSGRLINLPWYKWPSRDDYKVIDEAIETVDLTKFRNHPVSELSGGQQRRVLIARALTTKPRVLLMDEPTAGVDVENQRLLVDSLARLTELGVGLMIVSHELDPLLPVATRMLTVSHGELVYDGPLHGHERTQDGAATKHSHDNPLLGAAAQGDTARSEARRAAAQQARARRENRQEERNQPRPHQQEQPAAAQATSSYAQPGALQHGHAQPVQVSPEYAAQNGAAPEPMRSTHPETVSEPVHFTETAAEPAIVGTVIGAGKYRVIDMRGGSTHTAAPSSATPQHAANEYDPTYHAYATSNGYYQHPTEPEPTAPVVDYDLPTEPTPTVARAPAEPAVAAADRTPTAPHETTTAPHHTTEAPLTGRHAAEPQHILGHHPSQDDDFLPPPELKTTHQSLWR